MIRENYKYIYQIIYIWLSSFELVQKIKNQQVLLKCPVVFATNKYAAYRYITSVVYSDIKQSILNSNKNVVYIARPKYTMNFLFKHNTHCIFLI